MYLSSLRLHGFKSFARVTELRLHPGMTAVVGPNGSGKSNISDAIRWVLGEQSLRALRGVRAQDVIFSGNGRRRPLGFADVTLTLNNEDRALPLDFSEIAISRRVYQSGESEFSINGSSCRLRDIQELLMDTGLGRGGLWIISQGEIDAVLSARPEDRRAFIEELARISGYRARKRQALDRLEAAGNDRRRVFDLMSELAGRRRELEEQAREAERYRSLQERLQRAQRARLALSWHRVMPAWQAGRESVARLEEEVVRREEELRALEQAYGQLRRECDEKEEVLAAAGRSAQTIEREAEEARHAGEMLQLRLARIDEEEEQVGRRVDELTHQLAEEQSERDKARTLHQQVSGEARTLAEAVAGMHRRFAAQEQALEEGRSRLEALRAEIADKQQQRLTQEGALRALQGQLASLRKQRERLAGELQEVGDEEGQIDKEQQAVSAVLGDLQQQRDALEVEGAEAEQMRAECAAALADERRRQRELERQLHEAQARLAALREMEETGEGYQAGTRTVIQRGADISLGIIGPVARLIDVDDEWQLAIETALGGALQHVVVRTDDDARRAIDYLKKHRAGRATFLPLNLLRPSPLPEQARALLGTTGIVGVAADLVRVDPEMEPVVRYLLGRTLVAETLVAAIAASRSLPPSVRLVTRGGELVIPGGAVSGGAYAKERGRELLARPRAIAQLQHAVEGCRRELAQRAERVDQLENAIRELEVAHHERRLRLEHLQAEIGAHRRRFSELEDRRRRLQARRSRLDQEASGTDAEIRRVEERLRRLEQSLAQTQADIERMEPLLEEQRLAVDKEREALAAAAPELNEAQARLAALQQREQHLADDVRRWETACERTARRLAEEQERLHGLAEERQQLQAAYARQVDKMHALREEAERAKSRLGEAQRSWQALRDRVRQLEEQVARARRELAEAQQRFHQEEGRWRRLDAELKSLQERAAALGLDKASLAEVAVTGLTAAALDREMEDVERELAGMPPVNLAAPGQLQEVTERLDYLARQAADLEAAEANLRQAISEIDRTSTRAFMETFHQVEEAFRQVFRELFGDGDCSLTLTDPSDPLSGGIDIHVKLPGKPVRHLLQLSGGERALIAIAFVFSMMRVRPVPFCVLDEVDASLDEANVGRFTRLLQAAAQRTQVIAITHRRPTMEVAQALYGVTMSEPGVSSLVSLSLEEVS